MGVLTFHIFILLHMTFHHIICEFCNESQAVVILNELGIYCLQEIQNTRNTKD